MMKNIRLSSASTLGPPNTHLSSARTSGYLFSRRARRATRKRRKTRRAPKVLPPLSPALSPSEKAERMTGIQLVETMKKSN
jgi:hypothetical protein